MKHLREDWDGIQDTRQRYVARGDEPTSKHLNDRASKEGRCSSILADEPVFLIRAKDPVAGDVVRVWASLARKEGADPALCARVEEWADQMENFALEHFAGEQHAPDVPEGRLYPSGSTGME